MADTKTSTTISTMQVQDIKNAIDLDHYTLAAYDSTESWQLRIVVVIPDLEEPAWVLMPRQRKPSRTAPLAIPSLEALTLELAKQATRMSTDYIGLRALAREDRAAGRVRAGVPVTPPWLRAVPGFATVAS